MFPRQPTSSSQMRSAAPTHQWRGSSGGEHPVTGHIPMSPEDSSFSSVAEFRPESTNRSTPQPQFPEQFSPQFSFVSDASYYHDGTAPRASNVTTRATTPTHSSIPTPIATIADSEAGSEDFEWFEPASAVGAPGSRARRTSKISALRPPRYSILSGETPLISTPEYKNKVFVVPVRGTETPLTLSQEQSFSTPQIQKKLSRANTEDVKEVALRMYRVLKQHGLTAEAQQAFAVPQGVDATPSAAASTPFRGLNLDDDYGEEEEELVGMDYILKDGIVEYLRDVAKLTPPIPQQVVRFYDISYSTKIQPQPPGFTTFGRKIFNCFCGLFAAPFRKNEKPRHLDILKDISGYIMPGSMTLLLGPPGSGKSSLLKVLAGRAETNKVTHLEGTVLFNNRVASEILLTRLIAYVNGQLNQHLPFLTVRETLEFAGDCSQGMKPGNFTPQMRRFFAQALVEGQDPYLEYILHVLGLKDIEHHLVGAGPDGITENDRNRLTTAEIAMGTYSVMLYDQPCFAQESLATYDLVSTLRAISRFQQCSAVMSLVQLSPEVFDLFDRIILLGEGQILYQGPRHDALNYFFRHGFRKPKYMDAADFLMEIAAGEGLQYLSQGHGNPSLDDLALMYKLSEVHKEVMRIVHSEDVIHALWVESESNLGLSMRKKKQKKTVYISQAGVDLRQVLRNTDDDADAAGNGDVEVVVSKLSGSKDRSPYGRRLRGIESSGKVEIGDLVTGISLPKEDMFYLNVSQSKLDQRQRASSIAKLLASARGHVRLQIERIRDPETMEHEEAQSEQFSRKYIQSWRKSTTTLIKRQIRVHRRVALFMQLRLLQVLVMGLFGGALFYKVGGSYDIRKLNATRSLGFVTTGNLLLVSLVQLPLFMSQRTVFYKQRKQRFLRVSSYIISQSIVGIPQALLEALLYSATIYFLAGLETEDKGIAFLENVLLMFVIDCYGTAQVLALSGLAVLLEHATAFSGMLVALYILFSGFMIYPSNMPRYWRWVAQINPLRWANVAFCANQYERLYKDPCTQHVNEIFFCAQYTDPVRTVGFAFQDHYELMPGGKWYWISIGIIVGLTIFMLFVAYIVYLKIEHSSVIPSLPSQTQKNVQLAMPQSTETDARHDTPSGISWTGFIVQGDVNLIEEVHRLEKSAVRGARVKSLRSMMEDCESAGPVPESESFEGSLTWRSSSLPVPPATISFYNITLWVQDPKTKQVKHHLDKVSGYAKPGKMLALMGGNKSGTTTLLKCLANRGLQTGQLSGEILVNGYKLDSDTFSRTRGFVERLDAHQPFLTIRESLMFSAALRLPRAVRKEDRLLHIDLILDLLELTHIADQLVGSVRDATGKTFELAKKITLAVELAANPSILFLDEPTSGLDGLGARNVIHAMQTIAASGRTIITTIQHPSSRMLSAFQKVILLCPGGQQVYFGPVGTNCSHLLGYFESIPKVPKYDMKKNPVTHVFDILGCGIKTRDPMYVFSAVYRNSSLANENDEELKVLRKQSKRKSFTFVPTSGYPASFYMQAVMVLLRTQKFLWRNVGYTFGRIVSAIAVGLMVGLVYLGTSHDTTISLTSRSLYIYAQVLLIGIVTANNVVPQLGTDRLAYFRERRAGMYYPVLYPISWAIAEVPYVLLATLIFVSIGNGLAGIGTDSAGSFLTYCMSLFVFTVGMAYFAMLITISTPLPMLASFIVSIFLSLWITASGVVVTLPIFPRGLRWTFWADPFQFVMNTLTAVGFHCDVSRPECLPPQCLAGHPCPACNCDQLKDLQFRFSWTVLKANRAIEYSRIPLDFAALSGMAALFATLAFIAFVSFKHNRP